MPASATQPPRVVQIANLWTLWDHPTVEREWSLDRKMAAIREAGFEGITAALDRRHGRLARKHGLITIGYISSSNPAEFRRLIAQNLEGGAVRINVQLGDHDTPVARSIRMAIRIIEEGAKLGCPCDIEVHRDTSTETPEKTYAIAAGYRKATGRLLPITWDFSHISCLKHLAPPYWDRLLVNPRLVQHARQFHFRPFNGHHCQVPVTDGTGRLSPELKQWLPFLEKTLEMIHTGTRDGREIYVCPEMGPVRGGYNFASLPSSWDDARLLRGLIQKAWSKVMSGRTT